MEQVLAPRFEFKPKHPNNQPTPGFDYGEDGYKAGQCNVGINPVSGLIQMEIKGLAEPKSPEAVGPSRKLMNAPMSSSYAAFEKPSRVTTSWQTPTAVPFL